MAILHPDRFWSRREFLKFAGRAGLLSAIPTLTRAAAALSSDTVCISILHTTDLHGHILPTSDYNGNPDCGGMARCITQIRRWQQQNPNSILLDVGDVYQGTDVGLRSRGELMIDLFNHLKYDAWIIGNHEFDWGMQAFQQALQRSAMPVLAANTVLEGKPTGEFPDAKHPFAKIQPFILKEVAGIKHYRSHYGRGCRFGFDRNLLAGSIFNIRLSQSGARSRRRRARAHMRLF